MCSWEIQLLLISFKLQIFIFVVMACGNEKLWAINEVTSEVKRKRQRRHRHISSSYILFSCSKNRSAYLSWSSRKKNHTHQIMNKEVCIRKKITLQMCNGWSRKHPIFKQPFLIKWNLLVFLNIIKYIVEMWLEDGKQTTRIHQYWIA